MTIKERPILFSKPMIKAILEGTKTQTRRAMKTQPCEGFLPLAVEWYAPIRIDSHGDEQPGVEIFGVYSEDEGYKCPFGAPGDRLWVRENGWERPERTPKMMRMGADTWRPYAFDADAPFGLGAQNAAYKESGWKRRPSIHMPRWASRLTLEITSVRVERLQDISANDALSEGVKVTIDRKTKTPLMRVSGKYPPAQYVNGFGLVVAEYASIWESINGPGSWAANLWVWVIEFKVLTK